MAMPMEEFHEHEVMWPEINNEGGTPVVAFAGATVDGRERSSNSKAAPVNIPPGPWQLRRHVVNGESYAAGGGGGSSELIPPHILASRCGTGGKAAFSVCSGKGRTLKGRDLWHVRDSVLRKTGFLEC